MRIRKLAKLHGFTFCNDNGVSRTDSNYPPASSSPVPFLESHICHLNQSPWDVAVFSPEPHSPFQVDGDDGNLASFVDSNGAVESISVGGGDQMHNINNNRELQPWRPRKGNRRHETAVESSTKQATKNSHDFYYYSGFGPRWCKRRGSRNENGKSIGIMETEVEDDVTVTGEEGIHGEQLNHMELEQVNDDDDYDYNEDDDRESTGMKKRGRKRIKARSLKSLM